MSQNGSRRSDETFAQGLTTHGSRLLRIAYRILGDLHWAEDAVAETYLKAWQRRDTLRDERRLNPWLATVCQRQALELRRKVRRSPAQRLADEVPDGREPSPEGRWDEGEYRAELLSRLPKELRACASMFFVEGRSYAEIATITGLPLSTVRGRMSLSRDHLRKEMEMSSEPAGYDTLFRAPIERACGGVHEWQGCKVRYLGSCWTGSKTLYDARGKRLSRHPAGLQDTGLLEDGPFIGGRYEGATLSFLWRFAGTQPFLAHSDAHGATTNTWCQASSCTKVAARRTGFHRHRIEPPPDADTAVRLRTLIWGEPDRDEKRAFRTEVWAPGGQAHWSPGWGALVLFPPVPGAKKGTCRLHVAFSSDIAERGAAFFGLDEAGKEIESRFSGGVSSGCAEGHIRGETHEFDLSPEKLKGLVVYPRHSVVVDWGRVKLPPRPKGKESP